MRIYIISLVLNGILFVLALIYSVLRYQETNGNVQGKSEEYKLYKFVIILFFLICLIPEIQGIINLNLETIAFESIDNKTTYYDVIPFIISNALFFLFCISYPKAVIKPN